MSATFWFVVVGAAQVVDSDDAAVVLWTLTMAFVVVLVSESVNSVKLKRTPVPVKALPNWSSTTTVYSRLPLAAFVAVESGVTVIVAPFTVSNVVLPQVAEKVVALPLIVKLVETFGVPKSPVVVPVTLNSALPELSVVSVVALRVNPVESPELFATVT